MGRLLAITAICASLALAACGDDESKSATTTDSAPATDQAAGADETELKTKGPSSGAGSGGESEKPGITIATGESQFGQILFDDKDQAIYLFDKESGPKAECYGACAEAWPPVVTEGEPQAGSGVKAQLLGTIPRDDGTTQVTYNDHPLYYYAHEGPGEVTCHDVEEFGGLWLVVDPAGNAV